MGVLGMSSFIQKQNIKRRQAFSNCVILVDGSAMMYAVLTAGYGTIEHQVECGGDYPSFEKKVTKIFENFQLCNITPIVVLDGATPKEKHPKKLWRLDRQLLRYRFTKIDNDINFWHHLAREVYLTVLQKMGVFMVQAPYEADDVLTFFSYRFSLPILTNDSDFYFFREPVLSLMDILETDVCDLGVGEPHMVFQIVDPVWLRKHYRIGSEINFQLAPILIGNDIFPALQDTNPNWPFFKNKDSRKNERQTNIFYILKWLSTQNNTLFKTLLKRIVQAVRSKRAIKVANFVKSQQMITRVDFFPPLPFEVKDAMKFFRSDAFYPWYQRVVEQMYEARFDMPLTHEISDRALGIVLTNVDFLRPIPEGFNTITFSAFDLADYLSDLMYSCLLDKDQYVMLHHTTIGTEITVEEQMRCVSISRKADWSTIYEDVRINKLLEMLGIDPKVVGMVEKHLRDQRDQMLIFSLIYLKNATEIPDYVIETLLISAFVPHHFPNHNDQEFYQQWLEAFEANNKDTWEADAIDYYNRFQVVFSSIICLTRIMDLQAWNPADRCARFSGMLIAKLAKECKKQVSRPAILRLHEQFPLLKTLQKFVDDCSAM